MRTVIVGASSGLGRCVGVGLAQRGARVALLARRRGRLDDAAKEAGAGAVAITCDVTDEASCRSAIADAAGELGGIDGLVYTTGIGPLSRLADTHAETWRRVFDTNVTGAALVTAAALPHLTASAGTAVYFSSVSASQTPPWPGLGAYAVSKAAQGLSLMIFPVSFVSSAMVPVDSMPGWLQPVAENQPITVMTNAVRSLALGDPSLAGLGASTSHYVTLALVWAAGMVAVFAPLAVQRYRRS